MTDQLNRLLKLVQKTGDKLVVYDSSGRLEPVVIMDLLDYEELLMLDEPFPLTEEGLSDKIKGDIEFWQKEDNFSQNKPNFLENVESDEEEDSEDDFSAEVEFASETAEEPMVLESLPWADDSDTESENRSDDGGLTDDGQVPASVADSGFSPVGSILESRLAELQARAGFK